MGFPLWWILGVSELMPIAVALLMARNLKRGGRIRLPGGWAPWALFLVWVTAGIFLLWTDAPGAVPGGGPERLVVYGYRLTWYLALTSALLWAVNTPSSRLPLRRVASLMAVMFVYTTVGGILGSFLGAVELKSALELVLPASISGNGFVSSLIHPGLADVQDVLGYEEPRPKAPFAYANSWGSNYSLLLPFVFVAWLGRDRSTRTRLLAVALLLASSIPVVYSLNRGLWACLAIAAAGAALLSVRRLGTRQLVLGGALVTALGLLVMMVTPLGTMVSERFANPHSNSRRLDLAVLTLKSVIEGSPVAGFGSTRDVQGSFGSIAGGSTPECPACGVPPLGTQGHFWLVLFSQGLVGVVLFLGLFVVALFAFWRCRTTLEALATLAVVFLLVQMWIYDVLGLPLFITMLIVGLAWRERFEQSEATVPTTLAGLQARTRESLPFLATTIAIGILAGAAQSLMSPTPRTGSVDILVRPYPVVLAADNFAPGGKDWQSTIDNAALLAVSDTVLSRVLGTDDPEQVMALRRRTTISATPNTQVLTITVRTLAQGDPSRMARAIATEYLAQEARYLRERHADVVAQYNRAIAMTADDLYRGEVLATRERGPIRNVQYTLAEELGWLNDTSRDPGEILRSSGVTTVRRQTEVPVVSGALLGLLIGAGLVASGASVRRSRLRR
ncbi:hypothetical protein K8W59_03470 [Nocardioides rotundus]|uniref:hypothetical protein n=1 Tax=Nocardioides rotundus TaxID=1774216 RepID=UPI001CBE9A22|nr:hypothetical protein [Nocardioides rotundus]UAL30594.1 hypothetical protein K8W59_03470 [Nocardioides rotundus]